MTSQRTLVSTARYTRFLHSTNINRTFASDYIVHTPPPMQRNTLFEPRSILRQSPLPLSTDGRKLRKAAIIRPFGVAAAAGRHHHRLCYLVSTHDNDNHSRVLRSLNLGLVHELRGKLLQNVALGIQHPALLYRHQSLRSAMSGANLPSYSKLQTQSRLFNPKGLRFKMLSSMLSLASYLDSVSWVKGDCLRPLPGKDCHGMLRPGCTSTALNCRQCVLWRLSKVLRASRLSGSTPLDVSLRHIPVFK